MYALETGTFTRAALRKLISDVWLARGATQLADRWSKAAADGRRSEDAVLGYALSPTTTRGWIGIVASPAVHVDRELLTRVASRTTCWVDWELDHSNLHGSQRVSKKRSFHPRDYDATISYASLCVEAGWDYLTFSRASWSQYRSFAVTERTRQHPHPPDPDRDAEHEFTTTVMRLDTDAAIATLAKITTVTDDMLERVFTTLCRVEFLDVANYVLQVGRALAKRRSLDLTNAVRLLEVSAIVNDDAGRVDALAALARARKNPKRVAAAVADGEARFATAIETPRTPHDGRANMKRAAQRFRRWLAASSRERPRS